MTWIDLSHRRTAPEHRFVSCNGLRIHALDYGGRNQPAIFLHGITGIAWMFDGVAANLESRRVIAVDLRGHGDSQWSMEHAYGSADAASDIEQLIRQGGQSVDLVGSSWGGLIALVVAARASDLVERVVVIDVPPATNRSPEDLRPKPESFRLHEDVLEWERTQHPNAEDDVVSLLAEHGYRPGDGGRLDRKYDPFFLRRWPFRTEDHWAALARVQQQTLLIRGASSPALAAETANDMVATLPDGQLSTLANAGHLPEIDDPSALATALDAFLGAT
jgi:pimeloyl-ACP methyl ester carboxylesterase